MTDNYEIRLASGVDIRLYALFQYRTYSGLLEGLPTRALNKKLVGRALEYANVKLWLGGAPYLIPPVEAAIGLSKEDWFLPEEEHEPVNIPPVVCLATFESLTPALDPDADFSSLNVVWFQKVFALPIDPGVLQEIRALDWRAHATDGYR